MTTTDPQRLDEALHDTLRDWPALTGQEIPLALACAAEHPFIPGALCRVVGPHDLHDYDGLDDWATDPKENDRD